MSHLLKPRLRLNRAVNYVHAGLLLGLFVLLLAVAALLLAGPAVAALTALFSLMLLLVWPRHSSKKLIKRFALQPLSPVVAASLQPQLGAFTVANGLTVVPQLFRIPHQGLVVFASGHGRHAVIAVSDGIIGALSARELVAVLAHELCHLRHGDTEVMWLVLLLQRAARAISLAALVLLMISLGFELAGSLAPVPWLPLWLLVGLQPLLRWLGSLPLHWRELAADRGAVSLTRDPGAMLSALQKLESVLSVENETALRLATRNGALRKARTHPQIEKRLAQVLALTGNGMQPLHLQAAEQVVQMPDRGESPWSG